MSKPKPTFVTSDWHLFHDASLEFDNRPFDSMDDMVDKMVRSYNATVPKDGVCYFLGDMGNNKGNKIKEVVDRLNGTKVMILGNHDKGTTSLYSSGFDVVLYGASLVIGKEIVTMSHCPLRGIYRENITGMRGAVLGDNWHGESKHDNFSFPDYGQFHLHGHIHSPNRGKSSKILGKQFDVGVVANSYRPISISVIESWITKYKRENKDEL